MPKYLNQKQVAEILGVKPETVSHNRCIRKKGWDDLQYVKIGGIILYDEEKFYAWLNNHTQNHRWQ